MDKQLDNIPEIIIMILMLIVIILMLIDPELTRNEFEFFALWLATSTIIGLLRHIFKQS